MWPFRKHPPVGEDPPEDAELQRVRILNAKTEQLADQLDRYANQLELALQRRDRKPRGST